MTQGMCRRDVFRAAGVILAAEIAGPLAASEPETAPSTFLSPSGWISDSGFRNITIDGTPGFQLKIRMIGYRGMPLTCLRKIELKVDGRQIDTKDAMLMLGNQRYRFDAFAHGSRRWQDVPVWYVLDEATLFVPSADPLAAGKHEVDGVLTVRMIFATAGRMELGAKLNKSLVLESD